MDELGVRLREQALLEGDFLLRSGRRSTYYLDKYRFETQPELLGPLGERLAAAVREHEPEAVRLAGPALGAVALAASASLASGLPFVIVRGRGEGVRHGEPPRGPFEPGELVCLLEDVVTSGGALRRRSKRCGKPVWSSETRSAWSIARRAARTPWPASACACAASTRQESSFRPPRASKTGRRARKIRMVEP